MSKKRIGIFIITLEVLAILAYSIDALIFFINAYPEISVWKHTLDNLVEFLGYLLFLGIGNSVAYVIVLILYNISSKLKYNWLIYLIPFTAVIVGVIFFNIGMNKTGYLAGIGEVFLSYLLIGLTLLTVPYYIILYNSKFKKSDDVNDELL